MFGSMPSLQALEDELIALVGDRSVSKHRMLTLLAQYDRLGGWVAHGATSCAVWWAEICGIERSTAREQLRVARILGVLPALDTALESGRLSYAKLKVISRLATPENVDELIGLAEECSAGRLGVALAAWQQRRVDGDRLSAAQYDARSLSWRTEPDGMVTFTLRLRPADAGRVEAAVDATVMRSVSGSSSSLAQSRADAILQMLAGAGGNVRAEMIVHVVHDDDGQLVASLADGTPVPQAQFGELLCGASLRALVHDAKGKPIDASPARPGPTSRQLRRLMARDKHCQHPGCRARTFLQAHHVVHRGRGGPTVIANLVLLCSFHHRLLHEIEGSDDGS